MAKPVILIFASYYLPGSKAGGPIRSIENIISHFSNDYEFKIITSDRDLGDSLPYKQIEKNAWVKVGAASVFYLARSECTLRALRRAINEASPDVLYFNSFFDPDFTIKPLLLRRFGFISGKNRVMIAPRGEFASGALVLKALKKKIYLQAAKYAGLYNNLIWQASSLHELSDIRQWAGSDASICIASNLSQNLNIGVEPELKTNKIKGKLRVVCVARIARNKNIDGALKILSGVDAEIEFGLYGPCEDMAYWQECLDIINGLPPNIQVKYHGHIQHELIGSVLAEYDLFFLPTHGENFGHVILEGLSACLPVLISDLTPWRDLHEKGVGWDLPLDKPETFRSVIKECAEMDNGQYNDIIKKVHQFVTLILNDQEAITQTRKIFDMSLIETKKRNMVKIG